MFEQWSSARWEIKSHCSVGMVIFLPGAEGIFRPVMQKRVWNHTALTHANGSTPSSRLKNCSLWKSQERNENDALRRKAIKVRYGLNQRLSASGRTCECFCRSKTPGWVMSWWDEWGELCFHYWMWGRFESSHSSFSIQKKMSLFSTDNQHMPHTVQNCSMVLTSA